MFGLAVLIPSPPVLVPELCGGRPEADGTHLAAQVRPLREAVLTAARDLAAFTSRWTVVGVSAAGDGNGPREAGVFAPGTDDTSGGSPGASPVIGAGTEGASGGVPRLGAPRADVPLFGAGTIGTFRGYGADVRVALSEVALQGDGPADPGLPLAVLIGGWVRGCVGDEVRADAWLVDQDAPAGRCVELGERLRRELDAQPEAHGVLVIADGAATLSTSAPGYLDPRAQAVQDRIDDALSAGEATVLTTLDTDLCAELGVSGRAAYQVLAGLFSGDVPKVETLYRAAPFGVGYQVSTWRPGVGS
ncbi:hypothetical protein [Nocardia miyunensis]|uniref:hypothetical protein n=1 Tax=Nocardia miyunensis TaxID=282684 RepID=UPI0012F51B3F|nr:hypothetical protein [Nocardia miyunensis]